MTSSCILFFLCIFGIFRADGEFMINTTSTTTKTHNCIELGYESSYECIQIDDYFSAFQCSEIISGYIKQQWYIETFSVDDCCDFSSNMDQYLFDHFSCSGMSDLTICELMNCYVNQSDNTLVFGLDEQNEQKIWINEVIVMVVGLTIIAILFAIMIFVTICVCVWIFLEIKSLCCGKNGANNSNSSHSSHSSNMAENEGENSDDQNEPIERILDKKES